MCTGDTDRMSIARSPGNTVPIGAANVYMQWRHCVCSSVLGLQTCSEGGICKTHRWNKGRG
eukprot:366245-Chlamydomonas_euryale.AAC.11